MQNLRNALARTLLLALALMLCSSCALAQDGYKGIYAYTFDYWGIEVESPAPYRVKEVINSASLKLEKPLRNPQSLYARGDDLYLCDTGNNRILHLRRVDGSFELVRIIESFLGDVQPNTFLSPNDIYVNEAGDMFIADTENKRVVKLDKDLNFLIAYSAPDDSTFGVELLPMKVASDVAGRVFVLARNINKGFVKYESDGTFTGYVGANEARFSWYDYLWKLFSTKEQRAQQESFVPTEYENMYMDEKGFIYAVTTVFSEYDLMSDVAKPIRKLNAIGSDILIKNGTYLPIGDLSWGTAAAIDGPSRMTDITVLDNGVYVALDRMRGRLFAYDPQGCLLYAMGGQGNIDGYFQRPSAIEHMGYDLMVLDAKECSITVLTRTEYGALLYSAGEEYLQGNYQRSADIWREVLAQNGNCELAYSGVGRALLQQKQYKEAMDYFAMPRDRKGYSDAFQLYRKEWVEKNIVWIFSLVAAALIVPLCVGRIKEIKAEVDKS